MYEYFHGIVRRLKYNESEILFKEICVYNNLNWADT